MSIEKAYLALRLVGPMQAWGFESQYNRRNTGRFPTKSALAGLICAAFGARPDALMSYRRAGFWTTTRSKIR